MKFKCIVEYEYPVEHKPPVKAELILHGDKVVTDKIEFQKTGHWIADVDKWGDVVTTINGYKCSECGMFNTDKDNYCPNCGAKMIEPQESEE